MVPESKPIEYQTRPMICGSNRPYIQEKDHTHVLNHKYVGGTDSLYYAYVQSPLCDWIVSKLPRTLAPNLITLIGFGFNVLTQIVMIYKYGDSTEGPLDSWFCIFACISFFCYCVLDNCDGKQARRTGSGSPMGMLFDHGLDACTAVMQNIQIQRMMQVGSGW